MNNLVVNREYVLNTDGVTWYTALEHLKKFKSVITADFFDTTSSAGDWSGYILQRIGNKFYLIIFNQENNYPQWGFTVYTDSKPTAMFYSMPSEDEILQLISDIYYTLPDDGFSDGGEPYTDEELEWIENEQHKTNSK